MKSTGIRKNSIISICLLLCLYFKFNLDFYFYSLVPVAYYSPIIFQEDLRERIIRNSYLLKIVFLQFGINLIYAIQSRNLDILFNPIKFGMLAFVISFLLHLFLARYIGGGDFKLIIVLIIVLTNFKAIWIFPILVCSSIISSSFSLFLLVFNKVKTSSKIPFAPFLIGTFWMYLLLFA